MGLGLLFFGIGGFVLNFFIVLLLMVLGGLDLFIGCLGLELFWLILCVDLLILLGVLKVFCLLDWIDLLLLF